MGVVVYSRFTTPKYAVYSGSVVPWTKAKTEGGLAAAIVNRIPDMPKVAFQPFGILTKTVLTNTLPIRSMLAMAYVISMPLKLS